MVKLKVKELQRPDTRTKQPQAILHNGHYISCYFQRYDKCFRSHIMYIMYSGLRQIAARRPAHRTSIPVKSDISKPKPLKQI
jgi:hypothetical protein